MNMYLAEFSNWADLRITLKHNWFDRLPDVVRASPLGGKLPTSLDHWAEEYPNFVQWISDSVSVLSPRQLLDLPAFETWPQAFRETYKQILHEEFLRSAPRVSEIVEYCLSELGTLDTELRQIVGPYGILHEARRSSISRSLENIARRLRDLPDTIQWPESSSTELPMVLVIDDLLGRVTTSPAGKGVLTDHAAREILELRRAFCERFHLLDEEFDFKSEHFSHPIARAEFCSAQRFDPERGFINDLEVVRKKFASRGGNSDSSAPWSLIIADVLFNTGIPNEHGRGKGESKFGIEHVVPWITKHAPGLPIVALTTEAGHGLIQRVHDLGVAYLHRTESSYVDLLIRIARGERATAAQMRRSMNVPENFVAEDPKMLAVLTQAWNIAQDEAGSTVLIIGDPGTGKERLARFIHDMSPRSSKKLQFVNCAQLSKELADCELFGYYARAFTGASENDTKGIFQNTDQGTLVLDEFADLDKDVQKKLLRTLEPKRAHQRPVEPRGNPRTNSTLQRTVNVRIVCCTNQPIRQVRKDLQTRVGKTLEIPPLKERPADIAALAKHFLSSEEGIGAPGLSLDDDALHFLMNCDLPGNARTLEQLLKVAAEGKGLRNIIRRSDLELAWLSVFPDQTISDDERSPKETLAIQAKLPQPSETASQLSDELSGAVATILGGAAGDPKWVHLSKAETDALDEALRGRVLDVISVLIEWALFRTEDVTSVINYITGQETKGRTPEDVFKRFLKLDQGVLEAISASPHVPDNARLRKIIEACLGPKTKADHANSDGSSARS